MSLIDDAIATTGRPVIVSQQHDTSKINWIAGMTDPGEMIACGYMPEARRLSGESDDAYLVRLVRTLTPAQMAELEAAGVKNAAIKRASLDASNGRVNVMVAGKPAWHGLGVNIADACGSADAMLLSGTGFKVGLIPAGHRNPLTGEWAEVKGNYHIVRMDTGAYLGKCGSKYAPIQNEQAYEVLDATLADFGAKYEAAGSLYGGKKVFMLVRLPKQSFAVNGNDRVEAYGLFTNSHDNESGVGMLFPTSERVVCANTLRMAIGKDSGGKGVRLRHSGDIKSRIDDAKAALGVAVESFDSFRESADYLSRRRIPIKSYADDVLDHHLPITADDARKGSVRLVEEMMLDTALRITEETKAAKQAEIQRDIDRRAALLEEVLTMHDEPTNTLNGMGGTGWAALNAVTQAVNHGRLGNGFRGDGKESRKFESVISDRGDDIMQTALTVALEYAKA